jgi:hypothetical protein
VQLRKVSYYITLVALPLTFGWFFSNSRGGFSKDKIWLHEVGFYRVEAQSDLLKGKP